MVQTLPTETSIRVADIQNRVTIIQGQVGVDPNNVAIQQKLDQIRASLNAIEQTIKNPSAPKPASPGNP